MSASGDTHDLPSFTVEYFEESKKAHIESSMTHFFEAKINEIAAATDLRSDMKRVWTKRFETAARHVDVQLNNDDFDWVAAKAKMQAAKQQQSSSTPASKKTRSGTRMTDEAFAEVEKKFKTVLESGNVWTLSTGTIVEKVMKDVAMATPYENPVHSMILNADDAIYNNKFTDEERMEIQEYKAVEFDEKLPRELREYLDSFIGITGLDELNDAILARAFHPTKQPDLFWARETILQAANLYNYGILNDDFIEDDIEYQIWHFIAKCFRPTAIRASSGKKKSQASTERHNQNRTLAGSDSVARQVSGCQPDMKCVFLNHELAFSEVGLADDGATGTKEIHGSVLKAPKMLKDFFSALTSAFPSMVRKAKTAAFIIAGFQLSVSSKAISYCGRY